MDADRIIEKLLHHARFSVTPSYSVFTCNTSGEDRQDWRLELKTNCAKRAAEKWIELVDDTKRVPSIRVNGMQVNDLV